MSLAINNSKIAALCPDEYGIFSDALDKFTDYDWATDSDMTLGESFKYVCDRVADGGDIDGTLGQNLKESIKAVIRALDAKGIHGVVPGVLDTETEVALLFILPEEAVFTRTVHAEGKRILGILMATEGDFEVTDCYRAV